MRYQITVRYGSTNHRYHTYSVETEDARAALEGAALEMPPEIVGEVDLVEVRVAPDPDSRSYIGE